MKRLFLITVLLLALVVILFRVALDLNLPFFAYKKVSKDAEIQVKSWCIDLPFYWWSEGRLDGSGYRLARVVPNEGESSFMFLDVKNESREEFIRDFGVAAENVDMPTMYERKKEKGYSDYAWFYPDAGVVIYGKRLNTRKLEYANEVLVLFGKDRLNLSSCD